MGYFFIGRHFIAEIASRGEPIRVLVRSRAAYERLVQTLGPRGDLLTPVEGDLHDELLGLNASAREGLRGKISHFVHLGALYELDAKAADLERTNLSGTRHALDLALDLGRQVQRQIGTHAAGARAGAGPKPRQQRQRRRPGRTTHR